MTTYRQSGVDMEMGDYCSMLAYQAAKKTFPSRKNLFGKPLLMDGGFTGALDFGDFYLVQNSDGVGTKIAIAEAIKKFDTLGYDLLAMVVDDAICVGAETVAITNTIDTNRVSADVIKPLMDGLQKACTEQKVVIPGGEIAEMSDLVNGYTWNSSSVGIVEKKKFITGKNVKPGDKIIGLRSRGFRSNGFSLVRHILKKEYGENWAQEKYDKKMSWGEAVLTPSLIYSNALLELLGRFRKPRKVDIKALAHVTGGGIPGNIVRVLGKFGADLDNLYPPHEPMLRLQEMGQVSDREIYEVWNMGLGMILVSNEFEKIQKALKKHGIQAQIIGEVTKKPGVRLKSLGALGKGKTLEYES